jgi:hypothetical protein
MSTYAATINSPMLDGGAAQPHTPYGLALGSHLLACAQARGRTFGLQCLGERLHELVGPRFCTTLFAAAAVLTLLAVFA